MSLPHLGNKSQKFDFVYQTVSRQDAHAGHETKLKTSHATLCDSCVTAIVDFIIGNMKEYHLAKLFKWTPGALQHMKKFEDILYY